jgi:protein-serine/threonine kinase
MAPSISQASTFSVGGGPATVHPSPQLDMGTTAGLNIRPLDMMMGSEEVYEELERRIDEMRGWLECVEVGLDDLLKSPLEGDDQVVT